MGERISTGIKKLDDILGGGFIPGKRVLVYGATGVGKSILGVTIAHAGIQQEGHPGIIIDIAAGVDEQGQLSYAKKIFGWELADWGRLSPEVTPQALRDAAYRNMRRGSDDEGSSLRKYSNPLEEEKGEVTDTFLRCHLPRTRRVIIDGSDPYESPDETRTLSEVRAFWQHLATRQHMRVGKESGRKEFSPIDTATYWQTVASDEEIAEYLASGKPLANGVAYGWAEQVDRDSALIERVKREHPGTIMRKDVFFSHWNRCYDPSVLQPKGPLPVNMRHQRFSTEDDIGVLLQTTTERDVFKLISRDLQIGSLDAEVNTILVMGYIPPDARHMSQRRALAVIKHRDSQYEQRVFEYAIGNKGIVIGRAPT